MQSAIHQKTPFDRYANSGQRKKQLGKKRLSI